jgi:hypothetical protein
VSHAQRARAACCGRCARSRGPQPGHAARGQRLPLHLRRAGCAALGRPGGLFARRGREVARSAPAFRARLAQARLRSRRARQAARPGWSPRAAHPRLPQPRGAEPRCGARAPRRHHPRGLPARSPRAERVARGGRAVRAARWTEGASCRCGQPSTRSSSLARPESLEATLGHLAEALHRVGYFGPLGVDAYRYVDAKGLTRWNPCGELNARYTMGYAVGMRGAASR